MAKRLPGTASIIGAAAALLVGCWEPGSAETKRVSPGDSISGKEAPASSAPGAVAPLPADVTAEPPKPPKPQKPNAAPSDVATIDAPENTLGLRAFLALVGDGAANVAFSPMSLEAAVALVGEAATADWKAKIATAIGRDYDELSGLDDAAKSKLVTLALANAIWTTADAAFEPSFKDRIEKAYRAHLDKADFSDPKATAAINAWVAEATGGAIKKIVERLPSSTSLVLVNAFHFKGDWLTPFDPKDTAAAPFAAAGGATTEAQMMRFAGTLPYAKTQHGQAARLYYRDAGITMTLYLPDLAAEPDAARKDAAAWLFAADPGKLMRPSRGKLGLPRFGLETEMDLTTLLPEIGLEGLFGNAGVIAAIHSAVPSALSRAVQRARFEVDETGAEAAAATAIVGVRSALLQTFDLTLDRPFYFSLRHEAIGAPLIAGYVADPAK